MELLQSASSFSNRVYTMEHFIIMNLCHVDRSDCEFGLDQLIRIQRQGCNSKVERREAEKSSDIETYCTYIYTYVNVFSYSDISIIT